jgi:hypothetical protein
MREAMEERARVRGLLEEHFFKALGRVIYSWAYAEEALRYPVATLLRTDPIRADIVLEGAGGFRARRDLVLRLADSFVEDEVVLATARELLDRMEELAADRNMLAHRTGRITTDAAPHIMYSRRFKRGTGGDSPFR